MRRVSRFIKKQAKRVHKLTKLSIRIHSSIKLDNKDLTVDNNLKPSPMVLEPRILFDAAAPVLVADALSSDQTENNSTNDNTPASVDTNNTESSDNKDSTNTNDTVNALYNLSSANSQETNTNNNSLLLTSLYATNNSDVSKSVVTTADLVKDRGSIELSEDIFNDTDLSLLINENNSYFVIESSKTSSSNTLVLVTDGESKEISVDDKISCKDLLNGNVKLKYSDNVDDFNFTFKFVSNSKTVVADLSFNLIDNVEPTIVDSSSSDNTSKENESFTIDSIQIKDTSPNEKLTLTVEFKTENSSIDSSLNNKGQIVLNDKSYDCTFENNNAILKFTGTTSEVNALLKSLEFKPYENYNGDCNVVISVTDLSNAKSSIDINHYIIPLNSDPLIDTDNQEHLSVDEGNSFVYFSNKNFQISDPDVLTGQQTTNQLIIQIDSLPQYGKLLLSGNEIAQGSTFSVSDISKLSFRPDGNDVEAGTSTSFKFTVRDGASGEKSGEIVIDLNPVNEAPKIEGTLKAYEGDSNCAIGSAITITDQEIKHADSLENQTVVITNINVNTQKGDAIWFDSNNDGVFSDDEVIENGFTFSADKLGLLKFKQGGNEPDYGNPTFTLTVTDNGGGAGADHKLSTSQDFEIELIEVDDDPVLEKSFLDVNTSQYTTISSDNLFVYDVDTQAENICYTITKIPTYGQILYRPKGSDNWYVLGVNDIFTQDDINNGRLQYYYYSNVKEDDTHDSLTFTVLDSDRKVWQSTSDNTGKLGGIYDGNTQTLKQNVLDILLDVKASGGEGTSVKYNVGDPSIDGDNGEISLYEGTSFYLSSKTLNYHSFKEYTLDSQSEKIQENSSVLVYHLNSEIKNGHLEVYKNGSWVQVEVDNSFTQKDVEDGHVRFTHDGSEIMESTISLTANNGSKHVDISIDVHGFNVNDTPEASTSDVIVGEAVADDDTSGYVAITSKNIILSDNDGADSDGSTHLESQSDVLWFHFESLPDNGDIEYWNGTSWIKITSDNNTNLWFSAGILTKSCGGFASGIRFHHLGDDSDEALKSSANIVVRDDLTNTTDLYLENVSASSNIELTTPNSGKTSDTDDLFIPSDEISTNNPTYITGNNTSQTVTLNFTVVPMNDPPLINQPNETEYSYGDMQSHNKTLQIKEGESVTITNEYLQAIDSDNTTEQRQFRLLSLPSHGQLLLNGKVLAINSTFTQQDIDNGRLTYIHDGSEYSKDEFSFKVSDGVKTSAQTSFSIKLQEN